jgi:hypothetical protein
MILGMPPPPRRRRARVGRFLALLVVLVALFLLLQLNRWLPGTWPGGGDEGSKTTRAARDESRLVPSTAPIEERIPRDGMLVEVRGGGGETVEDWSLAVGHAPSRPVEGRRLKDPLAFTDGFVVRSQDREIRHSPGPADAERWIVVLPETGGDGSESSRPVPREPLSVRARVVDPATGQPVRDARMRVRSAGGEILLESRGATLEGTVPENLAREAWVEVEAPSRPAAAIPLDRAQGDVPLPQGRTVEVVVRGADGRPRAGAVVTARYVSAHPSFAVEGREPLEAGSRVEADGEGRARVVVPEQETSRILVEAPGAAPVARTLTEADGSAPVEVVLEAGLTLPVRVVDANGKALRDATVLAATGVDGLAVERRATTDREGRAQVGPLPEGAVELYAHAPGHAWSATSVEAASASGTVEIRLQPAQPLRLVVESPDGTPLSGVRVRVVPEGDETPLVVPPTSSPWRTDVRGVLLLPDLPERAYTLRLHLSGHESAVLRGLRPGGTTWFATMTPSR